MTARVTASISCGNNYARNDLNVLITIKSNYVFMMRTPCTELRRMRRRKLLFELCGTLLFLAVIKLFTKYVTIVLFVNPNAHWKIEKAAWKMRSNGTTHTIAKKLPFSDIRRSGFYGEANSISSSRPYSEVPRLRQLSFPAPNHHLDRTPQ